MRPGARETTLEAVLPVDGENAEVGLAFVAGGLAGGAVAAATADPAGPVADLLDALWRRSIAGLHTLTPDLEAAEDWMDHLYAYDEGDRAHRRAVAEALTAGPSVPSFYDPDDELVAYARAVQRGDSPDAAVDARAVVQGME